MVQRLSIIGFGTVGQGLAEILRDKGEALKERFGYEARIVAVADLLKGSVADPAGLDIAALLRAARTGRLDDYRGGTKGYDALRTIREVEADVVCEATYTDLKTGEPAISHLRAAFETGKHVATTNKGPIALAYRELKRVAEDAGLLLRFEGTVMSGTPSLRLGLQDLAGCDVHELYGILNGTTNYILTRMEQGLSYEKALAEAQEKGYAEAVPDADVEGWDALGKVVILAQTVMGAPLKAAEVERRGITRITREDIDQAKAEGMRYKLIGRCKAAGDGVRASVRPEKLPLTDPLAAVMGAKNAVTFCTDLMGDVTLVGAGAGRTETGFALLSDLLEIHRLTAGGGKA